MKTNGNASTLTRLTSAAATKLTCLAASERWEGNFENDTQSFSRSHPQAVFQDEVRCFCRS